MEGEVDTIVLIETAGRYGDIGPALRSEANLEGMWQTTDY